MPLGDRITAALKLHQNGLLDEAIVAYLNVLPDLTGKLASTLHSNVGAIYMNKGENELARDQFDLSVKAEPGNAQSHFNLAVILTSKFEAHGKAIYHCSTALKLDPSMYKALHLMGNILQNLGKDADAQKYFVMAENLALEISEHTRLSEGDSDNVEEGSGTDNNKWSRFAIMGAKLGDVFTNKASSSSDVTSDALHTDEYQLICISERPLIFRIPQFITSSEAEHIKARAESQLQKSFVMGGQSTEIDASVSGDVSQSSTDLSATNEENPDTKLYRSSYNAWLHPDDLSTTLQKRLAVTTGLPLRLFQHKSEELQVVKYEVGGEFKVHHDSSAFHPRLLTALLYLNSVPSDMGGETWFPFAGNRREFNLSTEAAILTALNMHETGSSSSESEKTNSPNGLFVTPTLGDALIFFNHQQSGSIDSAAVHAGLPIKQDQGAVESSAEASEKWIANYWVEQDFKVLFGEE